MCLHGLDILSIWVLFFSLLCATASAFQYSHLAKDLDVLSRIVWTIHGHVLQEWTRCVFLEIVCILCADHVFWYPWFIVEEFNSCVCFPFWSARKHTWKYVLLSTLLHDQSRLQSFPCFQHQFVWLPFSRTLVCKGGQLFVLSCTWEHEIRVFEPELRCCVTLA